MEMEQIYHRNKCAYLNIKNYEMNALIGGKKTSKDSQSKESKKNNKKKTLWKFVMQHSKPSYEAQYDDDGTLFNTVANKGLEPNQIAVRIGGEYDGFSIKALETIKPILTDKRVSRAIKHIEEGRIQK